jgi:hypothetical protein
MGVTGGWDECQRLPSGDGAVPAFRRIACVAVDIAEILPESGCPGWRGSVSISVRCSLSAVCHPSGGMLARQSKVSALCLVAPRLVDEFFAALPVRVPHRHPGFLTISSGVGRFPFTGGGGAHGPGLS